jgi:23S rRNA pseudouridine2605 synthase
MVEAVGHFVLKLKRVRFGPLALNDLEPGEFRYLTDREANALRELHDRADSPQPSPLARGEGGVGQRPPLVRKAGWAKAKPPSRFGAHRSKGAAANPGRRPARRRRT